MATAAPSEVAVEDALLDPEEEEATVEEADADADDDVVSVLELEDVDVVEDSVMTSAEAEVLVMVTSASVLVLPTVVVLAAPAEPTVASPTLDSALPASEVLTAMSLDALLIPTMLAALLLPNTSNKVSSVSAVVEALLAVERREPSESSKLSSVYEPELELTALVDAEATVDVELVVSCAQAALTARAQARVKRATCIAVRGSSLLAVEVLAKLDCRVCANSQFGEWRDWSRARALSTSRRRPQSYHERAAHDSTSCGCRADNQRLLLLTRVYARTMPHGRQQHKLKIISANTCTVAAEPR